MITLQIILIVIAGVANGMMDMLQFKYHRLPDFIKKNHDFWNPEYSWMNKYKSWPSDKRSKFPLSKTTLVCFTDGWHLMKEIKLSALALMISVPAPGFLYGLASYILFRLAFSLGFYLIYRL